MITIATIVGIARGVDVPSTILLMAMGLDIGTLCVGILLGRITKK